MFMSSSASSVHAKAPERVKRPVVEDEDPLDMMAFSRKVERLGASQLTGLSKKDQDARTRVQLGLRQAKAQKMPYKRLLAVRKKMKAQDDASDALAKEAGMTARRKPVAGAGRFVTQAGGKGRGKGSGGAPSLGRSLSNGVLHVSQGDIKSARFAARKANKGGGKGGGKGEAAPDDAEKVGDGGKWHWQQKAEAIHVRVALDPPATKKEISVKFKASSLAVAVRGESIIDGKLFGKVEVDDCTWCLSPDRAELQVMLTQVAEKTDTWNSLLA